MLTFKRLIERILFICTDFNKGSYSKALFAMLSFIVLFFFPFFWFISVFESVSGSSNERNFVEGALPICPLLIREATVANYPGHLARQLSGAMITSCLFDIREDKL